VRADSLDYFWNVVSFVGLYGQVGITLLLFTFLVLMTRQLDRSSHYFVTWTRGWAALSIAVVILAIGFLGIPHVTAPGDSSTRWWFPATYLGYLLGKLSFLLLLLGGVLEVESGQLPRRLLWRGAALVPIYTLLVFIVAQDFNVIIVWEAVAFVLVCSYAGWRLLQLPQPRRSLGTRIMGASLWAMAATWTFYGVAFEVAASSPAGWGANPIVFTLTRYNSYYDTLLEILLAFGMVLMLQEDGRRELAEAHRQLLDESLTDPLTASYNRLAFTRGTFLQSPETHRGAVVLLDLDDLKKVNDRYGHEAGDVLLRHFVSLLRVGLRPSDQLYRWGGDEFLLLMPGASFESLAPRLEALLRDAPACSVDGGRVTLRLAASWGGADYPSLAELRHAVGEADAAMYVHKRARKANVVVGHRKLR